VKITFGKKQYEVAREKISQQFSINYENARAFSWTDYKNAKRAKQILKIVYWTITVAWIILFILFDIIFQPDISLTFWTVWALLLLPLHEFSHAIPCFSQVRIIAFFPKIKGDAYTFGGCCVHELGIYSVRDKILISMMPQITLTLPPLILCAVFPEKWFMLVFMSLLGALTGFEDIVHSVRYIIKTHMRGAVCANIALLPEDENLPMTLTAKKIIGTTVEVSKWSVLHGKIKLLEKTEIQPPVGNNL
jgi:hypothetical protein